MRTAADPDANDEIARVAFEIWQAEGEPDGRDHEHWMRAKRLVEEARAKVDFPQVTGALAHGSGEVVQRTAPGGSQPPKELGSRSEKQIDAQREVGQTAAGAPGPRNPEPLPATNDKGYVTIPSDEVTAPGAVSANPAPPRATSGPPPKL